MDHERTASESEGLAASLHTYLSETVFAFAGMTATEATLAITCAVADWAETAGWKCRWVGGTHPLHRPARPDRHGLPGHLAAVTVRLP
ncbi:hypothetical protein ABZY31_24245 [Streptomyces sp. NPDC006529]|uniref:hypothetical protein n=1 Tax=Streptomyces sp. NPDC006529 TaxID=3157177 RepID=UPI0033BF328B